MGVAPRRLFGWEPREYQSAVYDGDRLVGFEKVREPEFDVEQIALLRAHLRNRKEPAHGIPMKVATDAANQFRFKVDGPTVDWAANTLASRQDAFYKQYPDTSRAGHLWRVTLPDN